MNGVEYSGKIPAFNLTGRPLRARKYRTGLGVSDRLTWPTHRRIMNPRSEKTKQIRSYFSHIEELLDSQSIEEDDRFMMFENIYAEIRGKETAIAMDVYCSRVLERILAASTPIHIRRYFQAISPDV